MAPIPCLVCCELKTEKVNNNDDGDQIDSVFKCFYKMFLIKKGNQGLWNIKKNGKECHLGFKQFPFCKQCAEQLLTVWELHKKLNKLELCLREKLERSECRFEKGSAYLHDNRYYKIRHQILGEKVKERPSKRASKSEGAVSFKEIASVLVAANINPNHDDNDDMISPSNEAKSENSEENEIKSEPADEDDAGAFQFDFINEHEEDDDACSAPVLEDVEMKIIYFPTSPPTNDEGNDADAESEPPSHLVQEQSLPPSKIIEKKKVSKRTKKNESLLDSFLVEEEEEELTSGRRLRKRKNTKKIVDEDPLELSAPSSPEASWQKKKKKKAPVSHDHDDNSDPDFELPLESDHEEDLTCKICKKRFSKAFNLRAHSLTAHLKTPQEPQEHPCPICGKPFPLPSLIKKHQWTHFNTEEKEEAISRGDQPVPARYQSRFQCELCPKRFKTPGDLKRHQETVHVPIEERKELCPFCGDSFASLPRHIARVHETTEADKKHACFVCGKRFATQQELHNHRLVHDGKREWKCDQCPREFNLEKQLKKHKNSHLNIRSFQCQHCESAFTSKSNLIRHSEIYHGEGGSKAKRPRYIRGPAKTKFRKGGSESKDQTEVHLETDDLPKS